LQKESKTKCRFFAIQNISQVGFPPVIFKSFLIVIILLPKILIISRAESASSHVEKLEIMDSDWHSEAAAKALIVWLFEGGLLYATYDIRSNDFSIQTSAFKIQNLMKSFSSHIQYSLQLLNVRQYLPRANQMTCSTNISSSYNFSISSLVFDFSIGLLALSILSKDVFNGVWSQITYRFFVPIQLNHCREEYHRRRILLHYLIDIFFPKPLFNSSEIFFSFFAENIVNT